MANDDEMREVENDPEVEYEEYEDEDSDGGSDGEADEGKIKFPQRFFDKGMEPPAGKSISYNSFDTTLFPALEEALKEDEWLHLWNSPVGICLKLYKLDFGWASRLVHHFLCFQLVCKKKYEIWSLIGRSPLRFSLFEFEHITGLNCDYVENLDQPNVPVTEAMKDFWKKMRVSIKKGPSVDDLVACLGDCGSWTREERIRLGYLAIYVNIFEGLSRKTASKVRLARLAMDPAAFESYPWGRVAFKKLMESVKGKDLCRNSYGIDGFVQVLQVWTYFALPDFGSEYGDPFPNNPTPLLIAYQGSRNRKFVKSGMLRQARFNNFVPKGTYEEMWPRWDDEVADEKIENIVKAYYGHFGPWKFVEEHWSDKGEKASNVIKLESVEGGETSGKKVVGGGEVSTVVEMLKDHIDGCFVGLSERVTTAISGCESKIEDLTVRVGYMEKSLKAMEKSVIAVVKEKGEIEKCEIGKGDDEDGDREKGDNEKGAKKGQGEKKGGKEKNGKRGREKEQVVETVKEKDGEGEVPAGNAEVLASDGSNNVPIKRKLVMDGLDDGFSVVGADEPSLIVLGYKDGEGEEYDSPQKKRQEVKLKAALGLKRAKSDRLRKLAATQNSPFIGDKTARVIVPNRGGYDPFEPVDLCKINVLDDWLRLDPEYPLGTKNSSVFWFNTLRTPTRWLNDMHMDAGINLLRLRHSKHPEWFRSDRICFLDTLLPMVWSAKYDAFDKSLPNPNGGGKLLPAGVYDYYTGDQPAYCRTGKTWGMEVDDLYCPLHVVLDHWVALWISIPKKHIVVWDSDVSHASDSELAAAVKPFTVMLPYLLHELALPHEKVKYERDVAFTYERPKGIPQNKQSGDCGVYALKYIECHALGMPFPPALCDKNIKAIREKLAAEIFDETGLQGTENQDYKMLDLYDETK